MIQTRGFSQINSHLNQSLPSRKKKYQAFLISVNPCVNIRFCSCLHMRQVFLVQHSGHAPNQDLYFHTVCSEELRNPIISSLMGWMSREVGFHQHILVAFSVVSGVCLQQSWLCVCNTDALCMKGELLWLEVSGGGLAWRRKEACRKKIA